VLSWLFETAPLLTAQAPRAAVELLRRASVDPPGGAHQHDLLASRLAEALYRVGAMAEAEQVATRALDQITDPDLLVDLHWTLAQCRVIAGRSQESLEALTQALAGPGLGPRHRARLLVLTGRTHRDLGEVDTASRVAQEALAAGTQIHDDWTVGWALHVLTLVAMMRGEVDEALLLLFDRALAVAQKDPALTDLRLLLLMNHAIALIEFDRYEEAVTAAREVCQLADRTGSVVRLAQAHSALGQLLLLTGQWDDALVEVDVLPEDLKDPSVVCCDRGVAAIICFHRNEAATARRHLAAAAAHASRIEHRVHVAAYTLARSLDLEQTGAPADALGVLAAALDKDSDVEELLTDIVRLATKTGDAALADAAATRVETLAKATTTPHLHAAALLCRGLIDRDPTRLLLAAERYQEVGRPLPRAQALEAAAVALATAGDRSSAQAAYTRALDGYLSLNAAWDVARLQARFRALGIRRSPRMKHRHARRGWESLTPTEVKIAALVAQGMSNPKIASQLFLSTRTVATHVSHVLTKLEVHSRIDIAREAARRYSVS
jgi:DNA-binding NarL/FixJ family response regulator